MDLEIDWDFTKIIHLFLCLRPISERKKVLAIW